jgi:putative transposase
MARKPRIDLAGYVYHIMARGNNKRTIYLDERDYLRFQQMLIGVKQKHDLLLYAWALMPNHYHMLLKPTRDGTLSRAMQSLNSGYTAYFNRRHGRCGHLFQGRYKSILVEEESHLLELIRYIHCNPVRARLVENPEDYAYSSYCRYLADSAEGAVEKEEILQLFGARKGTQLKRFRQFVNERRRRNSYEPNRFHKDLPFGDGLIGSEEFRLEIDARIENLKTG